MSNAVVVMGVCGSGKTAVAAALAGRLSWQMVDADDLHAPESVAKMRAGIPLTDDDRWPWLDRVGSVLKESATPGTGVLVACSALRLRYRDRLRAACPGVRFIFLDGERSTIADRLGARQGHYMPAGMLDSQLQALERPASDEAGILRVAIGQPLEQVVDSAAAALGAGSLFSSPAASEAGDVSKTGRRRRRVAVVGAGIMGSAIARRLLQCGHHVAVFDLDPTKVEPLVALGATAAGSASEAARDGEFVVTSLNSASIVRAAVFGKAGVCETLGREALLIDMSSIDPKSTRALAEELKSRSGAGWVDAPLSGGAPKAILGRLTVMAGGTEEDVERARELMQDLCARYTRMGPSGAGQTTKLVNQLLCAIGFQSVAEAVRLAEAGGVDATQLAEALKGGRADSHLLQEFGPKMAARDYSPTGRLDNMLKDLEAVQELSMAERVPLPLTAAVAELHRSLVAAGLGGEDNAAAMKQFDGFR